MTNFTSIDDPRPVLDDDALALEGQLLACEAALGVSLCVHDHVGFFRNATGEPLLLDRNVHRHPFCRLYRHRSFPRCNRHCVEAVHRASEERTEAFLTACWKGLREIVIPLRHQDLLLATLFVGGWRGPGPDFDDLPHREEHRALHGSLPRLEAHTAVDLAAQLSRWAQGLIAWVLDLQAGTQDDDDRCGLIRRFIFQHAHEPVRLADLAARLCLSPSRCSHLVRELLGTTFQELLMRERIERARVLLGGSPHTLQAVAERCGFTDVYYFSRCFRRRVGMPPGSWRRRRLHG